MATSVLKRTAIPALLSVVFFSIGASVVLAQSVKSMQSYNYRDHYIRHRNYLGEITRISTSLDKQDASFKLVTGLAGGSSVSFESVNYPGYFLRHQNFRMKLHKFENTQLFRQDASFRVVEGRADRSWRSFESVNYPGHYIRHRNFHLYLERGSGDLFRKDVTFQITAPWSGTGGGGGGYNPYGR